MESHPLFRLFFSSQTISVFPSSQPDSFDSFVPTVSAIVGSYHFHTQTILCERDCQCPSCICSTPFSHTPKSRSNRIDRPILIRIPIPIPISIHHFILDF